MKKPRTGVLPGFGLSLGLTLGYLGLVVILPLAFLALKAATLPGAEFRDAILDPRVLAACRLSLGASLAGAAVNGVFGLITAWVLVRYDFPGKRLVDALVDLPFALPTAVAGIALTALYAPGGWIGKVLAQFDMAVAYTPLGVGLALSFIGLPFVVRTLQPVLESLDPETEKAAISLGANRRQTLGWVVLPALFPAWLTGVTMAFARSLGEYGSVVFISGNLPFRTEIVPLVIMGKLEQFQYAQAAAISVVMLAVSFILLFASNLLQARILRYAEAR